MSKKLEAIIDGITKEYNEFAYVTSHDLGAALRAVVGFSDLILQRAQTADNLDDKTLQQLDLIKESGLKAQDTVSALLRLSRLNTRKWDITSVSLEKAMTYAMEEKAIEMQESEAVISVADLPKIVGDSVMIKRVFTEILDNAIKFSSEGVTPKIDVTASEDDDYFIVNIKDNGIGLNKRDYERVLLPLKKAGFLEKEYEGSGMELAIVTSIMRRMSGDIKIVSNEGEEGITVSLYFFKECNQNA